MSRHANCPGIVLRRRKLLTRECALILPPAFGVYGRSVPRVAGNQRVPFELANRQRAQPRFDLVRVPCSVLAPGVSERTGDVGGGGHACPSKSLTSEGMLTMVRLPSFVTST